MSDRTQSDWPIDPDGEEGSNGMRRFDMAILSKFEPKAAFPMTAEEFLDRHGAKPVRFNHQQIVPVSEIFDQVSVNSFATKTEFHHAVGEAIRDGGLWEYHAAH
ncbi:DUF5785 family protein [Halodesulfurarchaeum sp.]|uniref:DUF5785 family protein n=1 Tax=Halodesulfurarchaeum sp. TaxID=1980530 RepID=UPI001BC6C374|nr:hypothetical protein [Halodesulfurarchaeum sp.]